jgi:hypothetical protein
MPRQVRAMVVDPSVAGGLAIREIGLRDPDRDEAGVRAIEIRSETIPARLIPVKQLFKMPKLLKRGHPII